jgi:hypothetical protein
MMSPARWIAIMCVVLVCLAAGCATRSRPAGEDGGGRLPPKSKLDFYNDGDTLLIGVGTRAARLSGPGEFLPLHVVVANKRKPEIVVNRESFTLELPDGTSLPLASVDEVQRDAGSMRSDRRLSASFFENIGGTLPVPPYRWIELDFFPVQNLGAIPRDSVGLFRADVTFGTVYFRRAGFGELPDSGWHKLLFRPRGSDTTYVVDFVPYR